MNDIYSVISSIPNGRFFKICYRTEMPLTAEFKKLGWKIFKYTTRVTRTGVNYSTIKRTDIASSDNILTKSNCWLVKNKIKTNLNTGKDYIIIAPMRSGEHKTYWYKYECGTSELTSDILVDTMIPKSYFTKKNGPIRNINLANIVSISYGGKTLYVNDEL